MTEASGFRSKILLKARSPFQMVAGSNHASHKMANEAAGQTFQPTALVHENTHFAISGIQEFTEHTIKRSALSVKQRCRKSVIHK